MGELPYHAAQLRYRADIDGLRAFAVLAVVFYHAFPKVFRGGFVGVDVFFVISGYLITQIIVSDLDGAGFSFAEFYARRIRRIFPALILVLFATLAVGVWIFLPLELASHAKNALASTFFGANLMLLSESGYFDVDASLKPLLHLWSLGVEEQFYLAWPLALWLTPRRWRTALIGVTIASSFALNIALVNAHPEATFYLPFTRLWELIAGAALTGITVKNEKHREILAAIGAASSITLFLYNSRTTFPGWAALVPVGGTSATILSAGSFLNRKLLSHPVAVFIGRISFPFYLWHWPVLVFVRACAFRPLRPHETILLVIIAAALAWLTYEFVEKPVRFRRIAGVKTALAGMTAAAVLATVALVSPPQLPDELAGFASLSMESPEWRAHECMLYDSDPKYASSCVEPERPLVAIWGDSTAAALMPGLRDLQSRYGFGIAQFTKSVCPPVLVESETSTQSKSCLEKNREVLQLLAAARPKTVLFQSLWWTTSADELKPTIDALRAIGVDRIILLDKVPVWEGGLPHDYALYYRRTGNVLPARTAMFVEHAEEPMRAVANGLDIEYISLRNALCDPEGCVSRIGADLVVSDWLHLTPAGSKYVMNKIGPAFLGAETTNRPDSTSPSMPSAAE